MSRRLREKRNARANNVATILGRIREESGWDGMACSYGAHDFEFGEQTKTCRRCGAVYSSTRISERAAEAIADLVLLDAEMRGHLP